jgi:hypothetical protein
VSVIRYAIIENHWHRSGYIILVFFFPITSPFFLVVNVFLFRCVGVWQNDHVQIIADSQGNRTTPSYVSFSDNGRLIGDAAKNEVAMNPHNTQVLIFWP